MRLTNRCYPCILDDALGAVELLGLDEDDARQVIEKAVALIAEEGPSRKPPSYYITAVHRLIKDVAGIEEPFAELRKRTNEIGIELAKRLREDVAGFDPAERFRVITLWVVAANHLDFRTVGTGYGFDPAIIYSNLEEQVEKGLTIDMIDDFLTEALAAMNILYIHDNVGEVAIDAVLVEELRRMGAYVSSALRGGPITSDATMDDGRTAGIFEIADEVVLAGPDTLGISLEEMTEDLRKAMKNADLIVAKGQANYYVLTEYLETNPGRVAFLFSNKCDPVAERFNLEGIHNIVWLHGQRLQ